ncbi:MAG: chemotaxis protein CheC [Candidatus Riflebacteria bacterium]|nr:chemotaxis protein CheC [Candidatus Riflebacteria bacterium]
MPEIVNLRRDQLDALREVGNIGSGNAATALAQFLNRKIDMAVPQAKILPLSDIPGLVGGEEERVMGIYLRVMGRMTGRFLLLIPEKTTLKLLHTLIPGCTVDQPMAMNELERSCLREVGNILAGSFMNALSVLTRTPMLNSLPTMAFDMAGALLDAVIAEMVDVSDHVLMIEASFIDNLENMKMHIFLLPDPDSLGTLLELLGVK